jgi:phage/plasmid primase-like uncharacterized protein
MSYSDQTEKLCPHCNGIGIFEDEDGTWTCNYCDGMGVVIILEQEEEIDESSN